MSSYGSTHRRYGQTQHELATEANAIVANPNFDVLEFVKYLDIHYKNDKVIRALCKDPTIVLAIVESGYGGFLETCPKYINKEIFEPLQELGFEVWTKKSTSGSLWYGVVVNDNVCFHFRRLTGRYENNSQEFEVVTESSDPKKTLVEDMRATWRRLKMNEIGKPPIEEPKRTRKQSKMVPLREKFNTWLKSDLGLKLDYYYGSPRTGHKSDYAFTHRYPKPGHHWQSNYIYIYFRVLMDGANHIKVCVDAEPNDFTITAPTGGFPKTNKASWCRKVYTTKRIPLNDSDLFVKIMDFVTSATNNGSKFRKHAIPQLDAMIAKITVSA